MTRKTSAPEKVNILEMQRAFQEQSTFQEQNGIPDQDMDAKIKKARILTFYESTNPSNNEPAIMARLGTGVVFRHREGGLQIQPGETWVCEILERGTTRFAIGLLKLDAKAFFDLRSDQVDEMARVIWEGNRHVLEPRLEEMYRKRMEETFGEKLRKEMEAHNKKQAELTEQVEGLRSQLEAEKLSSKRIQTSLEKELEEEKAKKSKGGKSQTATAETWLGMPSEAVVPQVRRVSADELYSEAFLNSRRYLVHVSADRGLLTVRQSDRGTVECLDHRITLHGLGLITPYSEPIDVPAEYDPKYGGYRIWLKHIPRADTG